MSFIFSFHRMTEYVTNIMLLLIEYYFLAAAAAQEAAAAAGGDGSSDGSASASAAPPALPAAEARRGGAGRGCVPIGGAYLAGAPKGNHMFIVFSRFIVLLNTTQI